MRTTTAFVLLLFLMMVAGNPQDSHAAPGDIQVLIGGNPACTRTANGTSLSLANLQCPPTGTPDIIFSATARVEMTGTDSSNDQWRLVGTITANNTVNGYHIIFQREATQHPSKTTGATYYKTWLYGTMSDGAGNKIKASGKVQNPVGTERTMGIVEHDVAQGTSFNKAATVQWTYPPDLFGARVLKVDLEIVHLNQNAQLNVSNWIRLASQGYPDDPIGTTQSELSWLCSTTNATVRAIGCPSCVTEDGQVKQAAKVDAFTRSNWDNLAQEMAQGHGEYLTSLATLFKVPVEELPTFFALAQDQYRTHAEQGRLAPEIMVASLQEAMSAHPRWARQTSQPQKELAD